MKKSPVIVIVLVVSVALFTLISGASPASGNLCPIRDGEVVCTSDEKTYDSKRECLRECAPGQTGEPPVSPPDTGSCIDADGDFHGENCDAGPDCNDSEHSLTDNCNVCGNNVVEASNNEKCDRGNDNGKWRDVSIKCSDGSTVSGNSRCTDNCRLENPTESCPEGTQASTDTETRQTECNISGGKVICSSGNPRREFISRRDCLRECVPGQSEETSGGLCVEEDGRVKCTTENPRADFGSDFDECLLRCKPEAYREGPDLQVKIIIPDYVFQNSPYELKVVISNRGDEAVDKRFFTNVSFKDATGRTQRDTKKITITGLGPREEYVKTFSRVPTTLGILEHLAHVDVHDSVKETNENNNKDNARMTIRRNVALVTTAAWPHPHENNIFSADLVIENRGNTLTQDSKIRVFINQSHASSSTKTVCSGEHDLGPVQPGDSRTVSPRLKKRSQRNPDCILFRGTNYTLAVLVEDDLYTRNFGFGTDPENPVLVCPVLNPDNAYSLVSKPVGVRTSPDLYCDLKGVLWQQKPIKNECVNSFECRSNICAAGVCVDEEMLNLALEK